MTRWEFVRGSKRNKPYVRKVPWCRKNPTLAQRKTRYFLAKTSRNAIGKTGTTEYKLRTVPVVAREVAQEMKGKRFATEKRDGRPEFLLNIVPAFEALGKAVESHKFWNRDVVPKLVEEQFDQGLSRLFESQLFHVEKNKKS